MTASARGETGDREEGSAFEPKFGADGLATCVTLDASRGDVLMVAHMNEAALRATLATGILHYWSRSRGALWRKGDTSGQTQTLVEMRVDCDQDAFWLLSTWAATAAPATPAGVRASTAESRPTAARPASRSSSRRSRAADGRRPRRPCLVVRDMREPARRSASCCDGALILWPYLSQILWPYLARKFKFPSGREAAGSILRKLCDVQGGLSQKRF